VDVLARRRFQQRTALMSAAVDGLPLPHRDGHTVTILEAEPKHIVGRIRPHQFADGRDGSAIVVTAGLLDNEISSDNICLGPRPGFNQKDVNRRSFDVRGFH